MVIILGSLYIRRESRIGSLLDRKGVAKVNILERSLTLKNTISRAHGICMSTPYFHPTYALVGTFYTRDDQGHPSEESA
jgi:hypothetical protein